MVSISSHVYVYWCKTIVRTVYGNSNSNGFEVKISMQQGSALSPLLFVIVMEAIVQCCFHDYMFNHFDIIPACDRQT